MRVPLWLKIGWTVSVIAWVPFYWTQRYARPALPEVARSFSASSKEFLVSRRQVEVFCIMGNRGHICC
jgi:hypothetical protein